MDVATLLGELAAMAAPETRRKSARRLAESVGAADALVLLRDPRTGAFIPAAGFAPTLPGGPAWAALLRGIRETGLHRFELPATEEERAPALCCVQGDAALVLIDGDVEDASARALQTALPLLAAALRAERDGTILAARLDTAQQEISRTGTIVTVLDATRTDLQRAIGELDSQARALEAAHRRAEEAASAKDQFLAMLGHELRNPLSPIVTALALLRRRGIWSNELDIIERQVRHLLRLVDDLLDIARITRGKISLDRAPIEAAGVIAAAVETVGPLLERKRQRILCSVPQGLLIDADAARMTQVFSNLLANASKYSDAGQPIEVSAHRSEESLVVEVRDRGIGIDADLLEKIFALFEQQGRGIDRAEGGLGLGLPIVRSLVVLHGGSVEARSDGPGLGSCFVVTLPLSSRAAASPADSPAIHETQVPRQGSRVLLVDDNRDALQMLAAAVAIAGHAVATASDGLGALDLARTFAPDVAILDIGLPVMDGYELALQLRGQPGGHRVRLIALTGYGQASDHQRSREAGFDAHLVKPVDLAQLFSLLAALTSGEDSPPRTRPDDGHVIQPALPGTE